MIESRPSSVSVIGPRSEEKNIPMPRVVDVRDKDVGEGHVFECYKEPPESPSETGLKCLDKLSNREGGSGPYPPCPISIITCLRSEVGCYRTLRGRTPTWARGAETCITYYL